MVKENDDKALEQFASPNNKDLVRLEELADRFNIFKALGSVEKELAHSDFLAWLMDPKENHGFGNQFLKMLLERVQQKAVKEILLDIGSDAWDIKREADHIDIQAISNKNNYICAIENKIYSSEHDDQLQRYADEVRSQYPDHAHQFVFLTIWGESPSCDDYLTLTYYNDIVKILEDLLNSNKNKSSSEPYILVRHYVEMLRRYLVKDSEIQKLCRDIYRNHKVAIDLIFKYGQVILVDLNEILLEMVTSCDDPKLSLDYRYDDVQFVNFLPDKLGFIPESGFEEEPTKMLFFQFEIKNHGVYLNLYIAPGSDIEGRKKLHDVARKNQELFSGVADNLCPSDDWFTLYSSEKWLTKAQVKSGNLEDMKKIIEMRFDEFRHGDLNKITNYFVKCKNELPQKESR